MSTNARTPWLLLLLLVVAGSLAGLASGQTFSAAVDRFEADGNNFGSVGGALDFVDEFDNGTIAPDWAPLLGTAVEASGVVTLRDPGTPIPLPGFNSVVSNIENEEGLANGAGDFTASAYWLPAVPATDTEFHFQTYAVQGLIEAAGLTFTNLSAAAAAAQPGSLAGPAVSQTLTYIGSPSPPPASATVAVNPASITGRIVFRLAFDDATDMLTTAFSLDDGATFQSPFPPLHIFNGVTETELLLGAGAALGTPPPPPPAIQLLSTQLFLVRNPATPDRRKIVYRVRQIGPSVQGNPMVGGATLAMSLAAATQCFHLPASGWSPAGNVGFKYRDTTGAHGPVKVALIKRSGSAVFQVKAVILGRLGSIDIVPPGTGIPQGATNLRVGTTQYCGSTAGGTLRPNDAKTFKVQNAPPPASCAVAPCSPSGAFLDENDML
jgi:hypothetical protein